MKFSFSSVNTYNNCPRCFWLSYLYQPKLKKQENAFAQWGSFLHSLYERFFNGRLDFFDVCEEYEQHYSENVTETFPPNKYVNLDEKYYQSGLDALERFDELPDNIRILDIECFIETTIQGVAFIGYADLILQNTDTQEIYIVDHKSKAKFSSATEQKEYARQLYLYSVYVKEKYGIYPTKLIFNMFRAGEIVKIPFDETDLQEAETWLVNTVAQIFIDAEFIDKITLEYESRGKDIQTFSRQDFFCNELCGVREYCDRSCHCKGNAN